MSDRAKVKEVRREARKRASRAYYEAVLRYEPYVSRGKTWENATHTREKERRNASQSR